MDDQKLHQLAELLADVIKEQQHLLQKTVRKKRIFILFGETWNNLYDTLLDECDRLSDFDIYAILPASWKNSMEWERIVTYQFWKDILVGEEAGSSFTSDSIVYFPDMDRNTVIKAALGLQDTFRANLIAAAMKQGLDVFVNQKGLERFTGKEPKAYVKTILAYYKTLLDYGIRMVHSIEEVVKRNEEGVDEQL